MSRRSRIFSLLLSKKHALEENTYNPYIRNVIKQYDEYYLLCLADKKEQYHALQILSSYISNIEEDASKEDDLDDITREMKEIQMDIDNIKRAMQE